MPELALARLQSRRRLTQAAFFALFLLAPALNLLRFDLSETQLWVLGLRWSLGLDALARHQASPTQAAMTLIVSALLPLLLLVGGFLYIAWRWGRLYCGWLCPHFSLVEGLNALLHKACGRHSVWERPQTLRSGQRADARWWPLFLLACAFFGYLWAITLLSYLLPPQRVWGHLLGGTLSAAEARFILIAGAVLTLEMALARHLFCRFGCAVGLFQSLAWMANPKALVVAFDRGRARDCRDCATSRAPTGSACDQTCPMRLKPRNIKRMMFSCVQCGQCLAECESSHAARTSPGANLEWKVGLDAVRETLRQRHQERS